MAMISNELGRALRRELPLRNSLEAGAFLGDRPGGRTQDRVDAYLTALEGSSVEAAGARSPTDQALARLCAITRGLQEITAANDALRAANAALRERLRL